MSLANDCTPCAVGNHAQHERDHGIKPGVIGGTYCACSGDCADRARALASQLFNPLGSKESTQ